MIQDLYDQLPSGERRDIRTCKATGTVPVLDQSRDSVLGFHDDTPGVPASPSDPVVTFANHTCAMRLVTHPFSVIQNVFPMKGRPGVCDTRYLLFCTDQRFTITDYKGHHPEWRSSFVPLPPLPIQRKIAAILSAYDDLIENNNRRIKVLEEMAQRIYHALCVDFRLPGHDEVPLVDSEFGPIPAGWSWQPLFDVAEITFGFPFKSKQFNDVQLGTPLIRIRDLLSNGTNTWTEEAADPQYEVANGDLLIGMDGEFHMCKWAGGPAYLNQRVVRIRPKHTAVSRYALFLALRDPIAVWNTRIVGTTVAHLGKRHLELIKVLVPPAQTAGNMNVPFDVLFDLELRFRRANSNLLDTRDLLLPRLISGEIDVTDLDIATADAAA